jgi:hypothetical protein
MYNNIDEGEVLSSTKPVKPHILIPNIAIPYGAYSCPSVSCLAAIFIPVLAGCYNRISFRFR